MGGLAAILEIAQVVFLKYLFFSRNCSRAIWQRELLKDIVWKTFSTCPKLRTDSTKPKQLFREDLHSWRFPRQVPKTSWKNFIWTEASILRKSTSPIHSCRQPTHVYRRLFFVPSLFLGETQLVEVLEYVGMTLDFPKLMFSSTGYETLWDKEYILKQ